MIIEYVKLCPDTGPPPCRLIVPGTYHSENFWYLSLTLWLVSSLPWDSQFFHKL